jgi:hypothetical protein
MSRVIYVGKIQNVPSNRLHIKFNVQRGSVVLKIQLYKLVHEVSTNFRYFQEKSEASTVLPGYALFLVNLCMYIPMYVCT